MSQLLSKYDEIQDLNGEEQDVSGESEVQSTEATVSIGRSEALGAHLLPSSVVARALGIVTSGDESQANR